MKLSELENIKLPFRGTELNIKITKSPFAQTRLTQKGDTLSISLSSLYQTESEQTKEICGQIMIWYKAQARRYFTQEVEIAKAKYNFSYKDISIKDTVSRWGSCSTQKNFNFNWRLVMAPPDILTYVVSHEVCHLTYMDHSKDFWALVAQRFPKYKEAKQWLAKNGSNLLNFQLCG
jgi:predicted metal-dependent hydrolase